MLIVVLSRGFVHFVIVFVTISCLNLAQNVVHVLLLIVSECNLSQSCNQLARRFAIS